MTDQPHITDGHPGATAPIFAADAQPHEPTGKWNLNPPPLPDHIDFGPPAPAAQSIVGKALGGLSQAGDHVLDNYMHVMAGDASVGQMLELAGETALLGAGAAVAIGIAPEIVAGVGIGAAVLTTETLVEAGLGAAVGAAVSALPIVEGKILNWYYGK